MISDLKTLKEIAEHAYEDAINAIDPADYKALSAVHRLNDVNMLLFKRIDELKASIEYMKRLP